MTRLISAAVGLALGVVACGGTVTKLDGAVGTIPIFAPASLKERTTALTSDSIGDPQKFSTYTWHLQTDASPTTVADFYSAQWPSASRTTDDDQIVIRNPPLPSDERTPLGESVLVTVKLQPENGKTQFSIAEDVFKAKRR
jgi:hypothetical protein